MLKVSASDEVLLCHTLVRPNLLQNPWVQPAADTVNGGQRARGGECRGVPPSHDCQLEVAVDEFATAAALAEQTRSGSSWSAMRRLSLHVAIPLTATLVRVAMSAFEGEHNPGRVPTQTKGDELLAMQVSLFRWKAIPALREEAAKANKAHLFQNTTGSDTAVWHEKDKESTTLRTMQSEI